jgi:outer membrane protein assembly factor BamD (BamD/ComL family)
MRRSGGRREAPAGKRSGFLTARFAGSVCRALLVISLSALTAACGTLGDSSAKQQSDSAAFRKASSANTVQAYEDFIKKYPASDLAENARLAMEALAYQNAVALGTIGAFEAYLKDFPTGSNAWTARGVLEDLYFRWARQVDTEESWTVFLSRFPYSYNASGAQLRLAEIRFALAKKADTIQGYAEFNRNNKPYLFYEADAAAYAAAQRQNSVEAFMEYLKSFPGGFFTSQAEQQINRIKLKKIELQRRKFTVLQPL